MLVQKWVEQNGNLIGVWRSVTPASTETSDAPGRTKQDPAPDQVEQSGVPCPSAPPKKPLGVKIPIIDAA